MTIKKELKSKATSLQPIIRIGKKGLTKSQIEEIRKHLHKRKLIKVKLLSAFCAEHDRKQAAHELASLCNAELISITGFIVVLHAGAATQKHINSRGISERDHGNRRAP